MSVGLPRADRLEEVETSLRMHREGLQRCVEDINRAIEQIRTQYPGNQDTEGLDSILEDAEPQLTDFSRYVDGFATDIRNCENSIRDLIAVINSRPRW